MIFFFVLHRYGNYFGAGLDSHQAGSGLQESMALGMYNDYFDPGSTWATAIGDLTG
ncbi:MAG: hypothetical protein ACREBI_11025 [Nitrosotalea sp.]